MKSTSAPRQIPRGQARSRQILDACVRLFEQAGYQNVSIDDIGSAVGLTGPAVYRHYKGKYDILVQALVGQVTIVEELVALAVAEPPADQLDRLIRELAQLTVERDEAMLWRRENRHLEQEDRTTFRRAFSRVLAGMRQVVLNRRPELGEQGAGFIAVALLSLFSSTRDIRGKLTDEQAIEVLTAIAHSIVDLDYDEQDETTPPSPPASVRRAPAGRRERIIDAAADLFDQHGFYSVRIDDIARQANSSVATLYQHFEGKGQILQAILFRGTEGLLYLTAEAIQFATSPDEVLEQLIGTYVRQSLGLHGRMMRIQATDLIYLPQAQRDQFLAGEREYIAEWTKAISDQSPARDGATVRALAHAAIDVLTDLSQTRMLRGQPRLQSNLVRLARAIVSPTDLAD
ncbi:TetR/AcrR family transcriptional regulator (plasmid) [Rhodococcus sp. USK10]|uniref:TetR/AcrR family transcriptional regulator n=1 Tax=Rhodococcus sp. USK10 TaxID=2789739 RepID=UPI001C6024AA|nr:TetR/AcrR family transcriptional regulator [Rhodococcus sp. USK10]QYB00289.1 TetR/AcrR family transcriptional regulator [Rhodococcus sp. USK10]